MHRNLFWSIIVLFLFFSASNLFASTQSEALVAQGRQLLFNGGNTTYQGILNADQKFAAAVQNDPQDQTAILFRVFTRIGSFILSSTTGTELNTISDFFRAMGVPVNLDTLIDDDPPFGSLPTLAGYYNPPGTMPNGDDISYLLGTKFVSLVDKSLTDLDKIGPSINVVLSANELDDSIDTEIDYTDVLLAKGVLNTAKAFALIISAYDLDSVDLRDLIALDNADMLVMTNALSQLLAENPDLFKLSATGAAKLTSAKAAMIKAHAGLVDVKNTIKRETDNQNNDLFVFETEGDEQEFDGIINAYSEIVDSLTENRPASIQSKNQHWNVTAVNGDKFKVYLEEESFGNGTSGKKAELDFSATVSGQPIYGDVTAWNVNNSNQITLLLDYGGNKRIVVSGTLSTDGKSIANGTCTYQEYGISGYDDKGTTTFSATRFDEEEDDPMRIDFNSLFGNTGKSQIVIRDVLPRFDAMGEIIAGTFPEPVLNGIMPDFTTNDSVTKELELEAPYKVFDIPDATIALDGSKTDWPADALVVKDKDENFMYGWQDVQGMDIKATYLAKDDSFLYLAMELGADPIESLPGEESVSYYCNFKTGIDNSTADNLQIRAWYDQTSSAWKLAVERWDNSGTSTGPVLLDATHGAAVPGSSFLECKVPLSVIGDLSHLGGRWVSFSTSGPWGSGDFVDTHAQLSPVYTIKGTVSVPDGYTGGNIYYYLSRNPEFYQDDADAALNRAFTRQNGVFTLTGAAYSAEPRYLHIFWDKDGNGIRNNGDYTGMTTFSIQNDVVGADVELTHFMGDLSIDGVSVKNVSTAGNPDKTWLEIVIAHGFKGNLPEDIESISVRFPDGSEHDIWPDGGAVWDDKWNEFFYESQGSPMLGDYVFTIVAKDGSMAVRTDTQKDVFTIPVVDVNKVRFDINSKTPTFTWEPVHAPGGQRLTYRLEVIGVDNNYSFMSNRDWDMTSCTVPVLQPGKTYRYRIRAMDDSGWIKGDNRSHTDWIKFTMASTLKHESVPAIDLDGYGGVLWSRIGSSPGVDLWVKIIDQDGVAYDGSSHHVYARPIDSSGNLIGDTEVDLGFSSRNGAVSGGFSGWSSAIPQGAAGVRFFVKDPDGNQASMDDMMDSTPMVPPQDIALTCSVNGGTTPTFTWNPVQGANHYRIRIYRQDKSTVLNWYPGNVTSTTIPPGYLEPDTTYQYRLDARNAHTAFDIDENISFPALDKDGNYPEFTTGTQAVKPFVSLSNSGVQTWSNSLLGVNLNFWIKVYDAQGVNTIKDVHVIHPDGKTITTFYRESIESDICAGYSNDSFTAPENGTYTFVAKDKDGHEYTTTEDLVVNPIGYPGKDTLKVSIVNVTGADFDWEDVPGAAFYRLEIYDKNHKRIYKFVTKESKYSLAPGFLKQSEAYSFRVTTRREFWDQNTDNASSSPWSYYDPIAFKTGSANTGGTHNPAIGINTEGALVVSYNNPSTGKKAYWLSFSARVGDADGVPKNIKSVTVQGPGIAGSLSMGIDTVVDSTTADYWTRLDYSSFDAVPEGVYTFRVEDDDHNVSTVTDTLVKKDMPFVENPSPLEGAVVSSHRPLITWKEPSGGPYFYRVKLYQQWNNLIFKSGVLTSPVFVIPDQVLEPEQVYTYRIYAYDKDERVQDVDNLSMLGTFAAQRNHFSTIDQGTPAGMQDVWRIIQVLTGKVSDFNSLDADINKDDRINIQDALPILQNQGGLR